MIRVTVELLPGGCEVRKKTIGTAHISNNLTGTPTRGNYNFTLYDAGGKWWKAGTLSGFPRKKLLVWDLLFRALLATVGDRNKVSS